MNIKTTAKLSALLLLAACGPRVETREVYVPAAQGTETHGGDVLKARAKELETRLTKTQEELDRDSVGVEKRYRVAIRPRLVQIWKGLEVLAKRLNTGPLKDDLLLMTGPSSFPGRSKIELDIESSPIFIESSCTDYQGKSVTAAAKLGQLGGSVCVNTLRLAQEAPEDSEIFGLLSHEYAHHFGLSEERATQVQKFVIINWALGLKIWETENSPNSSTFLAEQQAEVDHFVVQARPLGGENLSCARPTECPIYVLDFNLPENSQVIPADLTAPGEVRYQFDARFVKPGIAFSVPLLQIARAGAWEVKLFALRADGGLLYSASSSGGTTRYTIFFK